MLDEVNMKKMLFTLFILFNAGTTYSQPKLFSSDWPVWNITEGMHKEQLLDNFNYRMKEYESAIKWFKAGNLEVTFMTLYDFISIQPTKTPVVILGVTDYSNGGDKIIFRKNIKTPTDLKGKKIVLASNTISLWLLHNYLEKHDMSLNDVFIINQSPQLAPLLFREDDSISAVVGWNPNIDKALNESSYVASTSADFPRTIYDLIVARKDFVDKNPDVVEMFLTGYYASIQSDSIIDKTAATLSISGAEYRSWLNDAKIFPSRNAANDEKQYLLKSANRTLKFLTTVPNSLQHTETKNRFKNRVLDIEKMIQF